jgi:hypothetical protein
LFKNITGVKSSFEAFSPIHLLSIASTVYEQIFVQNSYRVAFLCTHFRFFIKRELTEISGRKILVKLTLWTKVGTKKTHALGVNFINILQATFCSQ